MAITNLNLASSLQIKNALGVLRANYGINNSWIPNTNRYINNTIANIDADIAAGSIIHQDLVDYIASSSIIHCFNSWSYLSAAVNSYLDGDYSTAVHNAYYSELRSLMSFLAAQGVGVFNKKHIIVDQYGICQQANAGNGTHVFAKLAFDEWLKNTANTSELLNSIRIRNFPLKNWLDNAGFSIPLASLNSADLLTKWSIDINIIGREHDFRNFVSYRPQIFEFGIVRQSDDLRNRIDTVLSIWEICEPNRLFELIVLRKILDNLNISQTGQKYSEENESRVKQLLIDMGIDPETSGLYIVNFLKRRINDPDNPLFNFATSLTTSNPIVESDTEPIGILSRACLLLLTTTNVIENAIKNTGTLRSDLNCWYDNLGIKQGYWEPGNEPSLFSDLWQDIADEITEINVWLSGQGPTPSVYSFKNQLKQHTSNIRQISKSYFWYTN